MTTTSNTHRVADESLQRALQSALDVFFAQQRPITRLKRTPSDYRSSYALEELLVQVEGGLQLEIIFKDLSPSALSTDARNAKPEFLGTPLREIFVYRQLLSQENLGTTTFYGAEFDPAKERYWLFLAKVSGCELYQVGDFDVWRQAARWLAVAQQQLTNCLARINSDESKLLIEYDEQYVWHWMTRAARFQNDVGIRRIAARYASVVNHLMEIPRVVLHGDYYPANILVRSVGEQRICPIDWEAAAIGPGLLDLASLIAGNWNDEQKSQLANAYLSALDQQHAWTRDPAGFYRSLDFCRLHLAVQWLGWSFHWNPPPAQAQDWLGEALDLATKLKL